MGAKFIQSYRLEDTDHHDEASVVLSVGTIKGRTDKETFRIMGKIKMWEQEVKHKRMSPSK